ncbi:MAG: hypothetical protein Q9174_006737, partial [Haloplaca sp. 1 TL-2023]
MFPVDDVTLQTHPILSAFETEGWELSVSKIPDDSQADVVGTFANTFPGGDITSFVGEALDVKLTPVFRDIQGKRQLASIDMFGENLDNESKKKRDFFVDPAKEIQPKSKLPVDMLFSGEACDEAKNALQADLTPLADIMARLDPMQRKAFVNAMLHRISAARGPPGTGKSRLDGALIKGLVVSGETVAAAAASNVAVDNLLDAAVAFWKLDSLNEQPRFVRIYSESQIMAQWRDGESDVLRGEFHLDNLRYQRALKDSGRWKSYLEGRNELAECGVIDDRLLFSSYKREAIKLGQELLADGIVCVFHTTTGAKSPVLYEEERDDPKKLNWYYPATSIIVDEAVTIWRPALMMLAMVFRDAYRLILTGDPLQLPGLLLDSKNRTLWSKSYMQDIMDRGFPWVMLGKQYRMHDTLYAHTSDIIYKKVIDSAKLTKDGSPLIKELRNGPIYVNAPGVSYTLPSYSHFLDVSHGVQESGDGKSSFNKAEVEVVSRLVTSLRRRGVGKDKICVLTGYSAQKKALIAAAKAHGWEGVKILTVDSSQGTETEVMILSLVKTEGTPAFIGRRPRANVATSRQKEALYI